MRSWALTFAGFGVFGSQFHAYLPDPQFRLLMSALPVFITGILYMSGGAVWRDRHQFAFGVWLSLINAAGPAGPARPARRWLNRLGPSRVRSASSRADVADPKRDRPEGEPMHPQPATISWTRYRTLMMQAATVGLVFVAGWLAGGAALAISLSSGVAVAVVGAERITWPQRRKPQRQAEPITVRAKGSVLSHG